MATRLGFPPLDSYVDAASAPSFDVVAYMEECLQRIAAVDPALKAFVVTDPRRARDAAAASAERRRAGAALSPIDGMPVAVKDIIDTADFPTEMLSPIMAGNRPRFDAASVAALRRAGAIVVGKTVTTEFACGRSGDTVNPHDPDRTPGGSSSGSAAAVGAGLIPAALGTQTRASTIRPASFCGAYGFKPSFGALDLGGTHPVCASLDHLGVIAGSLTDTWVVARIIAADAGGCLGKPPMAGPLELPAATAPRRVAIVRTPGWDEIDDATQTAFDGYVARLVAAGADVRDPGTDVSLRAFEVLLDGSDQLAREIIGCEMGWPYRSYRDVDPSTLSRTVHDYLAMGDRIDEAGYAERLARRAHIAGAFEALSAEYDLFLTLAASPAPLGLEHTGSRAFITPWTLVGAPAISLPLLTVDGLPVGVQAVGPVGGDAALAARAGWLERRATFRQEQATAA
ncbi:amidase [Acuticoccus sp. M5D2P5]|uniref:amidase n=1 Tax=Acuticoccus kalidii TaxID=2910977 RepID=UPI001F323BBA|nr:amidase [Acuticoccus kalidii]MCF3936141.1 amidase [Acuticoccus kalidii]